MVFPFHFVPAAKQKAQPKDLPPMNKMTWDDGVPRQAWSEDGYLIISYFPNLTAAAGTVSASFSVNISY